MTEHFRGGRKKPGREYTRFARDVILESLETQSLTMRQMARLCQRDYETIRLVVSKLKSSNLVHITEWLAHDVGPHEAVWSVGEGVDEKKPPRLNSSIRSSRWRARKKPPVLVKRDPILAALMGVCRDSTMAE